MPEPYRHLTELSVIKTFLDPYGELANAQVMMKDYDFAQQTFANAYRLTGNLVYLNQQAHVLLTNKKWVASAQLFNQIVDRAPLQGSAHVGLLRALLAAGQKGVTTSSESVPDPEKKRKELGGVFPQILDLVNAPQKPSPAVQPTAPAAKPILATPRKNSGHRKHNRFETGHA